MAASHLVLPSLLLSAGISVAGLAIGRALPQIRPPERTVTVKGIAERDVDANVALWPLQFSATSDDLALAQTEIARSREAVLAFLARNGIDPKAVEVQRFDVSDRLASAYGDGRPSSRFVIRQKLMVRSEEPAKIRDASQRVGELVDAGVILTEADGYQSGPTYLFTKLNEFKPPMISEATASARKAAEEFARDAGTPLGTIRRANQGLFEILPRDRAPGISETEQPAKTLRVVATVEFELGG